jgi:hypothetical protein
MIKKDIIVEINSATRQVYFEDNFLGLKNENLQNEIIFKFKDKFVDGTPRIEIEKGEEKYVITDVRKEDESYKLEIKSSLLTSNQVNMQLVITEGTNEDEIPIFKSKIFYMYVLESINAEIEIPDEYNTWIDIANTKLNSIDEAINQANTLDLDVSKTDNVATIEITKKDGSKKSVEILDGSSGSGGTSDYNNLTNKPTINGVELKDNKTLEELGYVPYDDSAIKSELNNKANKSDIPDVSSFITKSVNDLENYLKTSETYTRDEVAKQIENNIGKEIQLDFNAILEDNTIIATLDESISDFELQNNTGYLFHIYLPLVTLTGDLDDNYKIILNDKDGNNVNINCMFQKDINETSTVGNLCQIQDYDTGVGYSWEFYGHFRKITDNGNIVNVVYTDTVVRETNPSMSGELLHTNIVNSRLKTGTTVMCLSDYENNGTKYIAGHTYLVENDSDTEDIILIATDITPSTDLTDYATQEYVNGLIGDINSELATLTTVGSDE